MTAVTLLFVLVVLRWHDPPFAQSVQNEKKYTAEMGRSVP